MVDHLRWICTTRLCLSVRRCGAHRLEGSGRYLVPRRRGLFTGQSPVGNCRPDSHAGDIFLRRRRHGPDWLLYNAKDRSLRMAALAWDSVPDTRSDDLEAMAF